jgi:hypothetical protein
VGAQVRLPAFTVDRLAGTGVGPEVASAYDLNGDVSFTTTASCGRFDYGNGATAPACRRSRR